jgi:hypothetical protein
VSWSRFLGTFMVGWILGLMLVALMGCDVPTEYTIHSPECPWPPPMVNDSTVSAVPLGCPYRTEDGRTVGGWPR